MQETYKAKLKVGALEKEITELDKKNAKDYTAWEFTKEAGKLGVDIVKAGIDLAATGASAGVGAVTVGLTTDGKKETMSQAATGFFTGYNASTELYNNTVDTVFGIGKDVVDAVGNDIKPQKEAKKKTGKKDKKE